MKLIHLISFLSLFIAISAQANAKETKTVAQKQTVTPQPAPQTKEIDKLAYVESYLNNITTLECNFLQYSSDGERTGKLYISKPYRIKWDYQSPKQALIMGSKSQFIYYNSELQEVSYIPSSKVPGFFLAHKDIKFGENVKVLSVQEEHGDTFLDLQDGKMQESNIIARIGLTINPMELFSIKIINEDQKSEVEILLKNIKINQPIEDKTFIFKDPNFFKLRK